MRNSPQVILVSIALAFAGCGGSGGGQGGDGREPGAGNTPPTIAGSPDEQVLEGDYYEFRPRAMDSDGDRLVFTIMGQPGWANFDPATGRLWGTPDVQDTGTFRNIQVSVSDGSSRASLDAFDIRVARAYPGSATLSWNPPTENADGSNLGDLTGYRIYYGKSAGQLDRRIVLDNPGLTRFVVENLPPARWHFAMTSLNSRGIESRRSRTVSKKVA